MPDEINNNEHVDNHGEDHTPNHVDNDISNETSQKINATSKALVALLTTLSKVSVGRLILYVIIIYLSFALYFYKDDLIEFFKNRPKMVEIRDLNCVSDLLYNTKKQYELHGVEFYLFQPDSHNKEYAERIFSKCDNVINTPRKIRIIDMIDTYNNLLDNNISTKNGTGSDVFDFAINSSTENDIAYVIRIPSANGGLHGMLIIYTEDILSNEIVQKLESVAKYILRYCN